MNSDKVQDKFSQARQEAEEGIEEGASAVAGTVGTLKEKAQRWSQQATDSTRKAAKATDDYVHENPWNVIGSVAFGCLIIGFLLGSRRD